MIEQLAEHGVQPADLTPPLMANARVKNPLAEENDTSDGFLKSPNPNDSSRSPKPNSSNSPSLSTQTSPRPDSLASPRPDNERRPSTFSVESQASKYEPLPAYEEHQNETAPEVKSPDALGTQKNIDIDIRWTVLCDLFLVLLADSVYDSRSRKLLELVGEALKISPTEICRFEKRATDSLEMQESKNKETWDEAEHLEARRKKALRRRYMMMGLATVGGTIIIGASAGALAPLIGAGLAAGFTTVGVSGTAGFLAGAGGTALIGGGAAVAGGAMGLKASHRRTGAVQTFEYRPLHNNKRVNLIVTISGWMNSKVDDVRLPFSTVDPVMGDIYSVLWEPEMLQSMGDTINVLANEVCVDRRQIGLFGTDSCAGSLANSATSARQHYPHRPDGISPSPDPPRKIDLSHRQSMVGLHRPS